jgi:hypothetical protein
MKAIITDNKTKATFATLDIDNSSLNVSNGGALYSSVNLHLKGAVQAAMPKADGDYQLEIEDDAGNALANYPSVGFQNYGYAISEQGKPAVVVATQNQLTFKIN